MCSYWTTSINSLKKLYQINLWEDPFYQLSSSKSLKTLYPRWIILHKLQEGEKFSGLTSLICFIDCILEHRHFRPQRKQMNGIEEFVSSINGGKLNAWKNNLYKLFQSIWLCKPSIQGKSALSQQRRIETYCFKHLLLCK